MSKKYLLPVKRAFEINFLTQLCRVKKYFYPRKCAVCRLCRQTVRAARMFGGKVPTGLFRRFHGQAMRLPVFCMPSERNLITDVPDKKAPREVPGENIFSKEKPMTMLREIT